MRLRGLAAVPLFMVVAGCSTGQSTAPVETVTVTQSPPPSASPEPELQPTATPSAESSRDYSSVDEEALAVVTDLCTRVEDGPTAQVQLAVDELRGARDTTVISTRLIEAGKLLDDLVADAEPYPDLRLALVDYRQAVDLESTDGLTGLTDAIDATDAECRAAMLNAAYGG